jgi:hypothetical protein
LDRMKQETTIRLRDGLIEMHMEKIRNHRELEKLKCQLTLFTSEVAFLKKNVSEKLPDSGTIHTNLSVSSAASSRESTPATMKSGPILKEMSKHVVLTYAKIISIVFRPLVKSIAWLITKCRGTKTRTHKIITRNR